jgi:NAD(P)-dependent dehydrogenase (short-subunit alcohol dehydrogenase family)
MEPYIGVRFYAPRVTRTYVVSGGTDGIGAAVARALVSRGDHAVVLGTNRAKARRLAASLRSAAGRLSFVEGDLSSVAVARGLACRLVEEHPRIDGLVLCARYFQTRRIVTAEGFEHNFALFYLSRLLLGRGLLPALEAAPRPVIVNVAGPGHPTPLDWDDLQSARSYDGVAAMFLTGRLNDLLGVRFAELGLRTRYVLFHPGTTSTGFVGEYDPEVAAFIERQKASAKPASVVADSLVDVLDSPPAPPLSALGPGGAVDVSGSLFSRSDAARLAALTDALLPVDN